MAEASSQPAAVEASLAEAGQLTFLDASKLRFSRHGATVRLTIEGDRSVLSVSVLRSFPLSEPQRFLSVRDGGGKEVGVLIDPGLLRPEDQQLVEAELERRYLVPAITRVVVAKERFGIVEWEVETDRGRRTFTTRNLRENASRPTANRVVLVDVDGNRFDVPDLDRLDGPSRKALLAQV